MFFDVGPNSSETAGFGELTPGRHNLRVTLNATVGVFSYTSLQSTNYGYYSWSQEGYGSAVCTYVAYDAEEDAFYGAEGGGSLVEDDPTQTIDLGSFQVRLCNLILPCYNCYDHPTSAACNTSGAGYCSLTSEGEFPIFPTQTLPLTFTLANAGPGTVSFYGQTPDLEVRHTNGTPFTPLHLNAGTGLTSVTVLVQAKANFTGPLQLTARFLPDQGPSDTQDIINVVMAPIEVRIFHDGEDITSGIRTTVVGKRIELSIQTNAPAIFVPHWSVGGTVVEGYAPTVTPCHPDPLDGDELKQSSVGFHWIDGGTKSVTCTIGGKIGAVTFQVDRPVDHALAGVTTTNTPAIDVSTAGGLLPTIDPSYLHFGDLANPGILIEAESDNPDAAPATIAILQVVRTYSNLTEENLRSIRTSHSSYVLDEVFPYDTPATIPAFANNGLYTTDVPLQGLRPGNLVFRREDAFRTYLMYRPSGTDSIWVTLRRMEWHWAGTAVSIDPENHDEWGLAPDSAAHSPNPGSVDTTTLPEWDYDWASVPVFNVPLTP